MPKKETEHIQNRILKLGKDLGFISVKEESLHGKDHYAPKYDVVWYLDLKKWYKLDGIGELLKNAPKEMFDRIERLPFAGFEIEGSDTTSKNQIGNFANLYSGNFLYNFVIVNNDGAQGRDIYRRGIKLKRYFSEHSGDKNVFMIDRFHLEKSIRSLTNYDNKLSTAPDNSNKGKPSGGETADSALLRKKIYALIKGSGLSVCPGYGKGYEPWLCEVKYEMAKEACGDDLESELRTGECFRYFYTGQAFMSDPKDKKPIWSEIGRLRSNGLNF